MTTIKIQNATPRGSESLCDSCYWAHIQKGYSGSEELALCAFLNPARIVPFKVRYCTDYNDKRIPSKREMEDIAWIIRTKDINRKVGFSPEDLGEDQPQEEEFEIVPAE